MRLYSVFHFTSRLTRYNTLLQFAFELSLVSKAKYTLNFNVYMTITYFFMDDNVSVVVSENIYSVVLFMRGGLEDRIKYSVSVVIFFFSSSR